MSDDPAMHDETMNARSFAKRGERHFPHMLRCVFTLRHVVSTWSFSVTAQGPIPSDIQSRPVLPYMPDKSDAYR
jgi:hypothetical protein